MRRVLVDLRVFLAKAVVLGASLMSVGLAFAGVYNAPVEHVVGFQGLVTARIVNYSRIVHQQNFTESGFPYGALVGLEWTQSNSGEVAVYIVGRMLVGPGNNGYNGSVCWTTLAQALSGWCAWTANGSSHTVFISQAQGFSGITGANYTTGLNLQGWYTYSTPAH